MDEGSYVSEAGSWSDTPPCVADCGKDMAAVLATWGRGRLPVMGRTDVRLAHQLPGKPAEGPPLAAPLIDYHSGDSSDSKISKITSWRQEQVRRHLLVMS